jgi:hypothetical protein
MRKTGSVSMAARLPVRIPTTEKKPRRRAGLLTDNRMLKRYHHSNRAKREPSETQQEIIDYPARKSIAGSASCFQALWKTLLDSTIFQDDGNYSDSALSKRYSRRGFHWLVYLAWLAIGRSNHAPARR